MKRTSRLITIIALPVLFGIVSLATAQTRIFPGEGSTDRLDRARAMNVQGEYDRALRLLLQLDREEPNQPAVLDLLFTVYKNSKQYDEAEDVLKRRQSVYGDSPHIQMLFADLLLRTDRVDEARDKIEEALAENPKNISLYPRASNIYRSNGFYDDAEDIYVQARRTFDDQTLYSLQLGQLYEVRRDYESAVREYYTYMTTDSLNRVRGNTKISQLIQYVDDEESITAVKRALSGLRDENPSDHLPRKYLANILMEQDSLHKALEMYKEVEHLAQSDGREMVFFARRCLERRAPELAANAANYVLDNYPNRPYYLQAKHLLATSFVQMDKPDSAITLLHHIYETGGQNREFLDAYVSIGNVFLDHKHQPDSALTYFKDVLSKTESGPLFFRVMIRIGDCHLIKGEPEVADSIYAQVQAQGLRDEDREHLEWRWAQTRFFMHEFEDAKRLYGNLSGRYYKSLYVNDCLQRMLMIDEHTGMNVIDLKSFADAEYLELRAMHDSAEVILIELAGRTGSDLADDAALELGEMYVALGDYQGAISAFRNLLDNFEDSFHRGEALKLLADTYLEIDDTENASVAYRTLLTEYENVSLKEHAREQLKKLENL